MTLVRTATTNFVRGELDPMLLGRTDMNAYAQGGQRLRNWYLMLTGGLMRRPGTTYLADLGAESRLMPFIFSLSERYVLAFQSGKVLVFYNDALVQTVNGCPWDADTMWEFTFTQSGDTMIIAHQDFATQQLKRTALTTFALSAFAYEEHTSGAPRYQPYFKFAASGITMTPSGTTGAITVTLSAAYWVAGHNGLIVRYKGKEILLTGITSGTVASGTVRETLDGTAADADWDEPTFSTVNGWPGATTFHDGRLWFGGSPGRPAGLWASKSSAFFNFGLGTGIADDGIDVTVGADMVNTVRHLVSQTNLQVFTAAGEFFIPSSSDSPITPGNIAIRRQTNFGSSRVRPQNFDGATVYVQRSGTMVREFIFSSIENSFASNPLSVLSSHLLSDPRDSTVMAANATRPEQLYFLVNDDGTIAVFHSIRAEKVAGWTLWSARNADTGFTSICAVDETLYTVAKRSIDGVDKWFLEAFADDDALTVDAAKTATSATKTFAGFGHLAGESVSVVSGAYYLGDFAVSGAGEITITQDGVDEITAGFNYIPVLTTMPADFALPQGPVTGQFRRIVRCILDVYQALHVRVQGTNMIIRQVSDDLSQPPAKVDGPQEFYLLGYNRSPSVTITQQDPLPLRIRSLLLELDIKAH